MTGAFSKELDANETITINISSAQNSDGQNTGEKLTISNLALSPITYNVTASANPSAGGTATVKQGNNTVSSVHKGESATFSATANTGYRFVNWTNSTTGAGVASDSSFTVTEIIEDHAYTANFAAIPQTTVVFAAPVTVSGSGSGGSYTVSGSTISGTQTLSAGSSSVPVTDYVTSSVSLSATAAADFIFTGWYDADGGQLSTEANWSPSLEAIYNKTVHAEFASTTTAALFGPVSSYSPHGYYTVTYNGTTQTMELDSDIYRVSGLYTNEVTVQAIPAEGYEFLGWLDSAYQPVEYHNPLTKTIQWFEQKGTIFPLFQYTKTRVTFVASDVATAYTVAVDGGAAETVSSNLLKTEDPDTSVVLTLGAFNSAEYDFDGWADKNGTILSTQTTWTTNTTALTGYTETTETYMGVSVTTRSQSNDSISPSFTWKKMTLSLVPGANGTLTAGPAGGTQSTIGSTTNVTELKTASYTLKATPEGEYVFVGWYDQNGQRIEGAGAEWTETFSTMASYGSITPHFQTAMVTMSVKSTANGTVSFNDEAVSGTKNYTCDSRNTYTLNADASAGYTFSGWFDGNGNFLSSAATWVTSPLDRDEHGIIYANFVSTSGLAMWQVTDANGATYSDLNAAIATGATKIILYQNGNLPAGNYTIPDNVTVLIPYESSYSCPLATPDLNEGAGPATGNAYRTLTMLAGAKITVEGKLVVGGKLNSNNNAYSAVTTGAYGLITMNAGSNIAVNGGALYCWGFISGSGTVDASNGATVYEPFQIADLRGGQMTTQLSGNSYKVFPFAQYYIQNCQVQLTINSGATEHVVTAATVEGATAYPDVPFVGGSGALFNISSGSRFVKTYDPATDRVTYDVYGNASLGSFSLDIAGFMTINTSDYVLPIMENLNLHIHSGTTTLNQDILLLPGCQAILDKNATLQVASGRYLYVYDRDEWVNASYQHASYQFKASYRAIGRSHDFTVAEMVDACADINGTIRVASGGNNGGFYTTAGGGAITSSEGTGKIVLTGGAGTKTNTYGFDYSTYHSALLNKTIYTVNYPSVPVTSAKLMNGVNRPSGVDQYTTTAGAGAGTTYYYCSAHDMWETSHVLTYHSNLPAVDTQTQTFTGGTLTSLLSIKSGWEKTGYHFSGWNSKPDGTGEYSFLAGDLLALNDDVIPTDLYAQWEANDYTLTFNPAGGNVTPTSITVTYDKTYAQCIEGGAFPVPTHSSTDTVRYTFAGWFTAANGGSAVNVNSTVSITGDTAVFAHWTIEYKVSFNANGGSSVADQWVAYNGFATVPSAPTKASYRFDGWYSDAELSEEFNFSETRITSSTTLYAKWTQVFTVTFNVQDHGTAPADLTNVASGNTIAAPTEPNATGYTFGGWYKESGCTTAWNFSTDTVTANTTLYAKWTANEYTINFKYQTAQLVNGKLTWADEKSGYTVKYTYGGTVKKPNIQYYTLEYWTLNNGETQFSLPEVSEEVRLLINKGTSPSDITVKAFFVRQTYTIEVYHVKDTTVPDEATERATVNVGRSISINAPETLPSDTTYKFAYWTIGTVDSSTHITERKTSYFNGDRPNTTVIFYAHYTTEGGGGTTNDDVQVYVRDYFVEPSSTGYTVGMTLQVIAPTDTSNFAIAKVDNKYQVGFGYTTLPDKVSANDDSTFGKRLSNNWGETWTSGTYVMRFWVEDPDAVWYSYGFVTYTLNKNVEKPLYQIKYATYAHQNTGTRTDYDTVNKEGPVGRN